MNLFDKGDLPSEGDASQIMYFKSHGIRLRPQKVFEIDVSNWPPEVIEAFIKELEEIYATSITSDINSIPSSSGAEQGTAERSEGGPDEVEHLPRTPGNP